MARRLADTAEINLKQRSTGGMTDETRMAERRREPEQVQRGKFQVQVHPADDDDR
jgi:hypothetical protein